MGRGRKPDLGMGFEFERAAINGYPPEKRLPLYRRSKRVALKRGEIGAAFIAASEIYSWLHSFGAGKRSIAAAERELATLSKAIEPRIRRIRARRSRRKSSEKRRSAQSVVSDQARGYQDAVRVGVLTRAERRRGYRGFTVREPSDWAGFFRYGVLLKDEGDSGAAAAFKRAAQLAQRDSPDVAKAILRFRCRTP